MEPEQSPVITRVTEHEWLAAVDDQVVGRGDAARRPDGRIFLSIDAWQGRVFDQLADVMLADLPAPLYTMVDESDLDEASRWARFGLTLRRRELLYSVALDREPEPIPAPAGVTILPVGAAAVGPLGEVHSAIRAEVDATVGWASMPVEVPVEVRPDPSRYAVAAEHGRYVGLVRVVMRRRHARIGLVAVRAEARRRGIGRALLADVLGSLHRSGIVTASADIDESNTAATALFEGLGARRAGSGLELVLR
jgi:ribosomal protein S18 acetylase RimI-like enzyme